MEPTVATVGSLVLHVPDGVTSLNDVERPEQTTITPVIDAGSGSTVTTTAVKQPVGNLYVISAVPNEPVPVTRPVVNPTLAIPEALLLQVPNAVASLN